MRAGKLFKELGFTKVAQNNSELVYAYSDDYTEMFVRFKLLDKVYMINHKRFIDRIHSSDFVPMDERPYHLKHSSRFGYWQSEPYINIEMRLHIAIHKQLRELNWIID